MDLGTLDALAVTIARQGDDLAWQVENVGRRDLWAFLLVPTLVDGQRRLALDGAWFDEEGEGTLVVKKVDTPVPEGMLADDVVRSGAVLLTPGEQRRGRVRLGSEVAVRLPYGGSGKRVRVRQVVLEVGWLPYREEAKRQLHEWQGEPFAYLFTKLEPGGQRFTRSAPLEWPH